MIYKFSYDGTFKGKILTLIDIICGLLFPVLIAGGITSIFIPDNGENEVLLVIVFMVLYIPSIMGYWYVVNKIKDFIDKNKHQKNISNSSNIAEQIAEAEKRIEFKYKYVGSIVELWEKDIDDDSFIHTGDFDTELMVIPLAKKGMKLTTLPRLFKIYFQIKQKQLGEKK